MGLVYFTCSLGISFSHFLPCISLLCDGPSGKICCNGYIWNRTLDKCVECNPGYFGEQCDVPCLQPTYGWYRRSTCNCPKDQCHRVFGCRKHPSVKTKLMNSSKSRFLSTVTAKSFSDPALEAHGMTWKTTKPSRETCKFCAVENEHVTETELSWTLIYSIASISVAAAILFFVYIWTFIKRDHCVSLQT